MTPLNLEPCWVPISFGGSARKLQTELPKVNLLDAKTSKSNRSRQVNSCFFIFEYEEANYTLLQPPFKPTG